MIVVNTLIQTTLPLPGLRVTMPFSNQCLQTTWGHCSAAQFVLLLKHLNQQIGEEGYNHMFPSTLRMETSWEETRWEAANSSKPQCHRKKSSFLCFCLVLLCLKLQTQLCLQRSDFSQDIPGSVRTKTQVSKGSNVIKTPRMPGV